MPSAKSRPPTRRKGRTLGWTTVSRMPKDAVAITRLCLVGGATVEQGFQCGRTRYVAKGWIGALNWFRIERSPKRFPPLTEVLPAPRARERGK